MYRLTDSDAIVRLSDGARIPADSANSDRAAYLAWLAAGNTPQPAETRTFAEQQAAAWEAIKAHRDRLSDTGGYQAGGKWFHSDQRSKTQQLSLFVMGVSVPPVQWKTMDGSFIAMTQSLAGQIFQAAAAQDQAIFGAAEQHKAAMQLAADPLAYDFSGGWPATFQE